MCVSGGEKNDFLWTMVCAGYSASKRKTFVGSSKQKEKKHRTQMQFYECENVIACSNLVSLDLVRVASVCVFNWFCVIKWSTKSTLNWILNGVKTIM